MKHFLVCLLVFGICSGFAQDIAPSDKALKYHEVLRKSPERSYLYDRFVDAWLENVALSALEPFLLEKADAEEAVVGDKVLLAYYYARQGDHSKALERFDQVIGDASDDSEIRLERAKIQARLLNFPEAVKELDAALAIADAEGKERLEIGKLKGRYLARDGKFEVALEVWKKLLAEYPNDEFLHEDVIESLAAEGLLDEAVASAEELAEKTKDPYDQLVRRFRVAELLLLQEKTDEAVDVYREAFAKTGGGSWLEREILARVDAIFRRKDDVTGLSDWVADLAEENPQRTELLGFEADLAAESGESDEAIELYRAILAKSPGERDIQDSYVDLLARVGKFDEAIEQQKVLIGQFPEAADARLRLAELYHSAKRSAEAGKAVGEFLELSTKSEIDYLRAARFLAEYEQKELAKSTFLAGKKAHPTSLEIPETEAIYFLEISEPDAGLDLYRGMAEKAKTDQLIRLARSLSAKGFNEEAYEIVSSREEDLGEDFAFLESLILMAGRVERRENLEEMTLRHLALADSPEELDRALQLATASYSTSDQRQGILEKLKAKKDRRAVETSLLAQLMSREGETERAIDLLFAASEAASGEDWTLLMRQQVALRRQEKNWKEAANLMEKLIASPDGRTSRRVKDLVDILRLGGRDEDALKWVDDWKTLSPGSSLPWLRQAEVLQDLERGDEAVRALSRASGIFGDDRDIQLRLAALQHELGFSAEAKRIYWKLYEETEQSSLKLRRVADLHGIAAYGNTVGELISEFEKRHQSNQTSVDPVLALAEIYKLESDDEAREKALKIASRLRPDDLSLVHAIADVQLDQEDWNGSLATLETALGMDSTGKTQQRIARIHIDYDDPQKGYEILTELAADIDSSDTSLAETVEEIGDIMIGNREYEIAVEYLEEYAEQFPENYRLMYLRAVALLDGGEEKKAVDAFLELAAWTEEMENPSIGKLDEKTRLQRKEGESQVAEYEKGYPSELVFWSQVNRKMTYAFWNRRNQGSSSLSFPASRKVYPPLEVSDVRAFAINHLRDLSATIDEPSAQAMIVALEKSGVPRPEVYLGLRPDSNSRMVEIPEEILVENPEDVALHLYWVSNSLYGESSSDIDPEFCLHAYGLLKENFPGRAAAVLIRGATENDDPEIDTAFGEMVQSITKEAVSIKDFAFALRIGFRDYSSQNAGLSKEKKAMLIPAIREMLPPKEEDHSPDGFDFFVVANHYASNGQWDDLTSLLEDYVKAGPSHERKDQTSWIYRSPNPAPFAFAMGSEVPLEVFGAVTLGKQQNRNAAIPIHEFSDEEIDIILGKTTHPILRFLWTRRSGDEEMTEKLIGKMAAKENPSDDEKLILGSWAEEKEEFGKASSYFADVSERASGLLSHRLDSALINAALKAGESEEVAWREGRRAALRKMAALKGVSHYENALVDPLNKLKLTREANKITKTVTKRSAASRVVRSTNSSAHQKIKDLVAKGDTDAALKMTVRELRTLGRTVKGDRYGQWRNGFWELRRAITDNKLTEDALAGLEKLNGSDSTARLYETGLVRELLGDSDGALKNYEKIIEKDPNHLEGRSRLAWVGAKLSGPDKVAAHLLGAEEKDRARLMDEVAQEIYGIGYDNPDPKEVYIVIEAAAEVLAEFPRDSRINDLNWLPRFFQRLVRAWDSGSAEVGHLHEINPVFDDDQDDPRGDSELVERRLRIYRKLSDIALEFPVLQRAIFTTRSAAGVRNGDELEKWKQLAGDFVKQWKKKNENSLRFDFEFSGEGQSEPLYGPEEFLIVEAWKSKDRKAADAVVESAAGKIKVGLDLFVEMHFCEDGEFQEMATKYLGPGVSRSGQGMGIEPLFHVIWCAGEREISYPVMQLIFGEDVGESMQQRRVDYLTTYAMTASKFSDYPGELAMMRDFRKVWMGDDDLEKIRETVQKASANNSRLNYSSPEGQFAHYCCIPLGKREKFFFPVTEVLEETGYNLNQFFDYAYRYRNGRYFTKENHLQPFLSNSPWFGKIADIRPVRSTNLNGGSMLSEFVAELTDDIDKPALRKVLAELPDSFFKSYVGSVIDAQGKTRSESILALIGEYLPEFQSLPPETTKFWVDRFDAMNVMTAVSPPKAEDKSKTAEAARWLTEQGAKTIASDTAAFFAANKAEDFEKSPREFEKRMLSLMRWYLREEPVKAADLFFHGFGLIKKKQLASGWGGTTSYNGWTTSAELLQNFMGREVNGLSDFAFYMSMQRRDKKGEFSHSGWVYDQKLSARMKTAIDSHGGAGQAERSIPAFLKELHQHVGDGPIGILALPMYDYAQNFPSNQRHRLATAADQVAAANLPESALAKELAMATRHFVDTANATQATQRERNEIPELSSWRAHALANLQDETMTGSWRVPLTTLYGYYSDEHVDDELAMAMGDVVADALENGHAFSGWNMVYALRAFNERQELEGWDETASRIKAGWWKKNQHNAESRNKGRAFDPLKDIVFSALDLHLHMGDAGAWRRFEKEFGNTVSQNVRVFQLLVQHGFFAEAKKQLAAQKDALSSEDYTNDHKYFDIRYTREAREQSAKFLAIIDNVELRFLAKTLLETAPDLPARVSMDYEYKVPWVGPVGRMMKAANEFNTIEWKDTGLRDRALAQLVTEKQTGRILAKALVAEYEKIDIPKLLQTKSTKTIRLGIRAAGAHCWNEIEKGNLEPLVDLLARIRKMSGSNTYRNEAREELATRIWQNLRAQALVMEPETADHVLAACQLFLEEYDVKSTHFTDHEELTFVWILGAACAGKSDQIDTWVAGLPADQQKKLAISLDGHHTALFPSLTNVFKNGSKTDRASKEMRQRVITEFSKNPIVHGSFSKARPLRDNFLFEISKKNLLSPAEMLEVGEQLHEAWPRDGYAAFELCRLARNEKQPDLCLKWGEVALSEYSDRTSEIRRIDGVVFLAENYEEAGKTELAKKTLERLPREPDPKKQAGHVRRLKELRAALEGSEK